jgi:hypothetical protein
MGENIEASRWNLRRRCQRCATPKRNPLQAQMAPELLHHETVTLGCTNTFAEPSELVKHQQTLSSQHPGQPLILASLRGGLAASTASLLCQRLRYLRPQ